MDLSHGCDLILDGTDNFSTRYLSSDVATWRRIPNVYGAVHRFEGQLSVFHPAALIEARLSEIPRSQHPIIAVCSIGQRSALAAATLRSLGFPTATHLANGLDSLP
jgi:molybdopterin/thiamine biosynthesis adenylyltransferase